VDGTQPFAVAAACRDLVLRAAAAADAGDASGLAALFTAKAVLERPNSPALQGREMIRLAYAGRSPHRLTRHLVMNTLVETTGPTDARATSLVLLWSGNTADAPGPHGHPADPMQIIGEFHDAFVLTGEGWRIAHRKALFVLHSKV